MNTFVTKDSELVIGLTTALGVNYDRINKYFEKALKRYFMKTNKIRVTPLIKEIKEKTNLIQSKLKETPEYERVNSYMNAGTEIRSGTGKGDVLALSVVANIHSQRPTKDSHLNIKEKIKRIAHIVQSLKHPDEVQRKDNKGKTIAWDPKKAQVRVQLQTVSYIDREERATKEIKQILEGKL